MSFDVPLFTQIMNWSKGSRVAREAGLVVPGKN
jgi:hypothetical protein